MVEVKSVFTIQKLFIAFDILAFSMLLPYLGRYFSHIELVSGYLFCYIAPLPFLFFAKKLITRKFMFFSFLISYINLFIFFILPNILLLYLFFFLRGLTIFFFWTPYNIRYFTFSHSMNRATSAGHFIIVGPILNSFIPLTSAFIITKMGYPILALACFVILVLLLYKTLKLPKLDINYSFKDVFQKAKGMRTLKFLQGIWEAGLILIPLYTLFFIKEELEFGSYLVYLGIVGVIATLIIVRFSDHQHQRLKFFFPLLILLSAGTLGLTFADSLSKWIIVTASIGIFSTLTYPFFFAVVLDKIEDKSISMITREYLLNSGRTAGITCIIFFYFLRLPLRYPFLLFGSSLVVYLLFLFKKGVYIDEAYHPLSPVVRVYNKSRKLVFKVYGWGKVVHLREIPGKATARLFDGAKWITVSVKQIGERTFHHKIKKGDTSSVFKKMEMP
jgi:hypothetical protein